VRSADIVVYPSNVDLENAINMFKPKKTIIIPNSSPICYESINEYKELRARRRDFDKPYFILLAGGRGKGNEEAVKVTIEVFNELPPEKFKLLITGPWRDVKKYVKNPSIELLGVVPKEKLKELLAISDYGLSPIFGHSSGTFLKILAYISAGLNIVSSLYGIIGVDIPKEIDVYLVKNKEEFSVIVKKLIYNVDTYGMLGKKRPISMCKESSVRIENILGQKGL
jgi:glycosyltransferase involved in cell wall biosynthesis